MGRLLRSGASIASLDVSNRVAGATLISPLVETVRVVSQVDGTRKGFPGQLEVGRRPADDNADVEAGSRAAQVSLAPPAHVAPLVLSKLA